MALFTHPSLIATLSVAVFHDLLQFTSPLPQTYKVTYSEFTVKLVSSIQIPHGFRKSKLFITILSHDMKMNH